MSVCRLRRFGDMTIFGSWTFAARTGWAVRVDHSGSSQLAQVVHRGVPNGDWQRQTPFGDLEVGWDALGDVLNVGEQRVLLHEQLVPLDEVADQPLVELLDARQQVVQEDLQLRQVQLSQRVAAQLPPWAERFTFEVLAQSHSTVYSTG